MKRNLAGLGVDNEGGEWRRVVEAAGKRDQ